jgi:hypothetical protein
MQFAGRAGGRNLPLFLKGAATWQPELATALEQGPNVYIECEATRGKSIKELPELALQLGPKSLRIAVDENGSFMVPRQIVRLSPQFRR